MPENKRKKRTGGIMKKLHLISFAIVLVIALVGGLIPTGCSPVEEEEEEEEEEEKPKAKKKTKKKTKKS